jgi:FtsZ-interacting cell division protein ZipA
VSVNRTKNIKWRRVVTELQVILLVCAVVFVVVLYWWGKKNDPQKIKHRVVHEKFQASTPEEEGYMVTPIKPKYSDSVTTVITSKKLGGVTHQQVAKSIDEDNALASRMQTMDSSYELVTPEIRMAMTHIATELPYTVAPPEQQEPVVVQQSQIFALLVLSPSRELSRKQIHSAMEASRLSFSQDGTYIHCDNVGNPVFRVANVVEPGFFPALDDDSFRTQGIALVLELPSTITPYRAMDEFITIARKVSQSLDGKLYDAQRHVIKESDLKAMREYAQNLTY